MDELSLSYFMQSAFPGLLVGLASVTVWYGVCRTLYRKEVKEHHSLLCNPDQYETFTPEEKMVSLAERMAVAKRGSPADRLFMLGIALAVILLIVYFGLWNLGLTPASQAEREMIELVKTSERATWVPLVDALNTSDNALYTSRQNYLQVMTAYDKTH